MSSYSENRTLRCPKTATTLGKSQPTERKYALSGWSCRTFGISETRGLGHFKLSLREFHRNVSVEAVRRILNFRGFQSLHGAI
jgi:hypothetical protein